MNFSPMILRLRLGLGDALRCASRKSSAASTVISSDAGGGDEVVLDLLDLAFAQQAVVDEHAGELVADGLVDEGGGDCGVDTAGQAADHFGVADLLADLGDLVLDDGGGVPVVAAGRRTGGGTFSMSFWPSGVCLTSGCHCTP